MDNWNGTPGIGGLLAIDTAVIARQKPNALASDVAETISAATQVVGRIVRARTGLLGALASID